MRMFICKVYLIPHCNEANKIRCLKIVQQWNEIKYPNNVNHTIYFIFLFLRFEGMSSSCAFDIFNTGSTGQRFITEKHITSVTRSFSHNNIQLETWPLCECESVNVWMLLKVSGCLWVGGVIMWGTWVQIIKQVCSKMQRCQMSNFW